MEELGKVFSDFPGFFKQIVSTTSEFGPLALGVLLLAVLLYVVYQFKGYIGNNRYLQIAAGSFVFVFSFFLLFFVYEAFQSWLRTWGQPADMVLVKGLLAYQLPGQAGGDLDFRPWATGDDPAKPEPVYVFDVRPTEKALLALAKHDSIELIVANRPLYRTCDEDQKIAPKRSREYTTKYHISLKGAYEKAKRYYLHFSYQPNFGPANKIRDFLTISDFDGIDPKKVTVKVQHNPDECLDEEKDASYKVVMGGPTYTPASLALNAFEALGQGIVPEAMAQIVGTTESDVFKLLWSSDRGLAIKARTQVAQKPAAYIPMITELLQRSDPKDAMAQVNVLLALKGARPNPFKLPTSSIHDVIKLSYIASPEVRQAARSYLTDPAIVDDAIVKSGTEFYETEKSKKKDQNPEYFLLLITIRDIYYVAGVNNVTDYRGDWGERERVPDAIKKSVQNFQAGINLIKDVPRESIVPFAKAFYGMALALEQRAAVDAALRTLGPKASSKDIDKYISEQVTKRVELPFTTKEEKAEFISTLDQFLTLVTGRENEYLWPAHIVKMKECRARQTYDCLHAS